MRSFTAFSRSAQLTKDIKECVARTSCLNTKFKRSFHINLILLFLQAWRAEGLQLSSSSNEACKLYDATLTQVDYLTLTHTHTTLKVSRLIVYVNKTK